ncbi:hypothetical protein BAE44_0018809 [Dichanthelium oligosanthes]|uniref:Uncharacterized protein n=1 Tax=Dichanthelium oligosanthes TaxID=888268 RepID=A0A1E5V4U4_9POAL|nr:hypothetical protein BAE44_0018809 [Dichanthelium oligosanthes]
MRVADLAEYEQTGGRTSRPADLRRENAHVATALGLTTQGLLAVDAENAVLRTQDAEVAARLGSINDILVADRPRANRRRTIRKGLWRPIRAPQLRRKIVWRARCRWRVLAKKQTCAAGSSRRRARTRDCQVLATHTSNAEQRCPVASKKLDLTLAMWSGLMSTVK